MYEHVEMRAKNGSSLGLTIRPVFTYQETPCRRVATPPCPPAHAVSCFFMPFFSVIVCRGVTQVRVSGSLERVLYFPPAGLGKHCGRQPLHPTMFYSTIRFSHYFNCSPKPSRSTIPFTRLIQSSHSTIPTNYRIQPSHPTIPFNHPIQPSYSTISLNHPLSPSHSTVPFNHPFFNDPIQPSHSTMPSDPPIQTIPFNHTSSISLAIQQCAAWASTPITPIQSARNFGCFSTWGLSWGRSISVRWLDSTAEA